MEYLNELNPEQKEAVLHIDGPMMVIAGAGSGKTRVLTYRIAHLIRSGIDPFNILSLTFTNKAAREMKERIATVVGENEARNIWMGTFHSVFARILRMESERINYPRNFTIYDTQDSKSLIKDVIKGFNLNEKVYKPGIVFNRISAAKNNLIGPEAYLRNTEITNEDYQAGRPRMGDIYSEYAKRCYRAGAMDFDDLLYKTNILLRDHADLLHKYQHKFRYILVDEYQDTNFAQYLIVKQLSAMHHNICVVGDDAQSIYSFRGANIQNILNFRQDYPDYAMYKLEQNYRSTQNIVEAANSVIEKNKDQIKKTVWTSNDKGELLKVHRAYSDNDEGIYVANQVFELQNRDHLQAKDFAILYRTNAQSRSFEEALRKLNIPYRIYGGLSFYQRKEIKDLLAYYRLTANPKDEEALKRVINYPARGIGKTTLDKLIIASSQYEASIWDIINAPAKYPVDLNKGTYNKLSQFSNTIKRFQADLDKKNAYDLAEIIARETGIVKELNTDKSPEGVARYENIQELLNGIKDFTDRSTSLESDLVTLPDFMVDVALLTDADNDDEDDNKVSMMTIHSAKGLEFPYVFVVGLEENLFPSQLSLNSRSELEEERRLFYVAITRAKKQAYLTYALSRYRWGQLSQCEPSRFLEDIDPQYVSMPKMTPQQSNPFSGAGGFDNARMRFYKQMPTGTPPKPVTPPSPRFKKVDSQQVSSPEEISQIQVGHEVEHARFGKGKVLEIEGQAPNHKATVFFPSAGKKQLLLKFAKLKVL